MHMVYTTSARLYYQFNANMVYSKCTFCNLKDLYSCPIDTIKGLTDKGQFQDLAGLKGPQDGIYLFTKQFLSLIYILRKTI